MLILKRSENEAINFFDIDRDFVLIGQLRVLDFDRVDDKPVVVLGVEDHNGFHSCVLRMHDRVAVAESHVTVYSINTKLDSVSLGISALPNVKVLRDEIKLDKEKV